MTHAALSPLIGPEFDPFLGAPIGEDRNGTTLSVLSALARLDVDPWREARALARMPREAAATRLTAMIDALPGEQPNGVPSRASAADLVALLPPPKIRAADRSSGATGFRQGPMLIGLSAFVLVMLVVLVISALYSRGTGIGVRWRLAPPTPQQRRRQILALEAQAFSGCASNNRAEQCAGARRDAHRQRSPESDPQGAGRHSRAACPRRECAQSRQHRE